MLSTDAKPNVPASGDANTTTIDDALEHAKRAFALKKYEQAVDYYATALELMTAEVGDDAPEVADLYLGYGRALLENAMQQAGVLGKDKNEDTLPKEDDASKSGAFLSFSGDAEEADEEGLELTEAVDKVEAEDREAEQEENEEETADAEPEDDFNAAWEVLDLARAIYDKRKDADDETRLKLAETYICLGDVSLETEKFEQAIKDYRSGLQLKVELLPQSSRQIAEAHYKLSMVLDLTEGHLAESTENAEKALASVEARLAELRNVLSGQQKAEPPAPVQEDTKGKGKAVAKGPRLQGDDAIQTMTKSQMEAELKELEGLREDVALKVEELKTDPEELKESAPALAAKQLDKELNTGSSVVLPAQVHDLTGIVKKKKKPVPEADGVDAATATKRKAEEEAPSALSEKKAKLESEEGKS